MEEEDEEVAAPACGLSTTTTLEVAAGAAATMKGVTVDGGAAAGVCAWLPVDAPSEDDEGEVTLK